MNPPRRAVLLMAYGTPASGDQVADYFTHIRGGRTPPPEAIEHLRQRYERVGGGTPLLKITEDVRAKLERALDEHGDPRRVYLGMRHWHPFIAETVQHGRMYIDLTRTYLDRWRALR